MRRIFLLLTLCALAFAPAPFQKSNRRESKEDDLQRMQGKWVRVKLGIGVLPTENNCPITITDKRMQFPSASDAWNLTLDPTRRPKTIDAASVGNDKYLFRGIYKFEGGSLIICWRGAGNDPERPIDFTPGVREVWYQVYKRP